MADKRKYVIPGDVITSGPFRPEQNVVLEGNNIIATAVGISEISDLQICTVESTDHFSYRRDGVTGRQAGLVRL